MQVRFSGRGRRTRLLRLFRRVCSRSALRSRSCAAQPSAKNTAPRCFCVDKIGAASFESSIRTPNKKPPMRVVLVFPRKVGSAVFSSRGRLQPSRKNKRDLSRRGAAAEQSAAAAYLCNKKAAASQVKLAATWQGQKDSNPQERFWRPLCYHYIMPLRDSIVCKRYHNTAADKMQAVFRNHTNCKRYSLRFRYAIRSTSARVNPAFNSASNSAGRSDGFLRSFG